MKSNIHASSAHFSNNLHFTVFAISKFNKYYCETENIGLIKYSFKFILKYLIILSLLIINAYMIKCVSVNSYAFIYIYI